MEDMLIQCKTGDLILYDFPYSFRQVEELITPYTLGIHHLGIIVKENDKLYLLECESIPHYCLYSKKVKDGLIMFDLEKRLQESNNTNLFFVKTNLFKHMHHNDVYDHIEKYKEHSYMDRGLNCITNYSLLLEQKNLLTDTKLMEEMYFYYDEILKNDFYTFEFEREIYKIK
jgi:hypothetical protein